MAGRGSDAEIRPYSVYSEKFDLLFHLKNFLCLILHFLERRFSKNMSNDHLSVNDNLFESERTFSNNKSIPDHSFCHELHILHARNFRRSVGFFPSENFPVQTRAFWCKTVLNLFRHSASPSVAG